MRITTSLLTVAALFTAACSQGPQDGASDDPARASSRLGGDAGFPSFPDVVVPPIPVPSFDAGACAPTLVASPGSCTITIAGTSCDCTDVPCVEGAALQCLGIDASVPSPPGFGAGCSQSDVDAAKKQFCSDVDAALAAQGLATTLDCAQIGQIPQPFTPPSSPPTITPCSGFTHAAFETARKTLAACSPAAYVTWEPTADLQLVEAGVCTPP